MACRRTSASPSDTARRCSTVSIERGPAVALAERWKTRVQGYRADSAIRRLPRLLIGYPMLSVQQAAQGLGVSVAAANGALNNLLKIGIVSLVNERHWGRVFQAAEVLQRLDRVPGRIA